MERLIQKSGDVMQKAMTKSEAVTTGLSGSIAGGALLIDVGSIFQAVGFILGTCYIAWQFYVSVRRYLKENKK